VNVRQWSGMKKDLDSHQFICPFHILTSDERTALDIGRTSPITIDSLDDSPARPQHKLLSDTSADSESEEGF
jgi:hypothetical protein